MKVLGIMASPIREGNADILLDKALEACKKQGARVEKLFLAKEQLPLCQACFKCSGAGKCVSTPEINKILNKIKRADALIISTPVWWYSCTSYLKILIDHFVAFVNSDFSSRIAGKKLAILTVSAGGEEAGTKETLSLLKRIAEFLQLQCAGELRVINTGEHGVVKENLNALLKAYKIGENLCKKKGKRRNKDVCGD